MLASPNPLHRLLASRHRGRLGLKRPAVLANKVLQLSIADGRQLRWLPLALAAEHRYVSPTNVTSNAAYV